MWLDILAAWDSRRIARVALSLLKLRSEINTLTNRKVYI